MTTNSTILFNVSPDDLKAMIREAVREEKSLNTPETENGQELFTVKETGKQLRVSQPTLDKLEKQGKLHSVKVGMKKFYRKVDILAFLQGEK